MNLEEANSIMNLSDEEEISIKEYLNLYHTKINILGNLSPENFEKLRKDWVLAETPEEVEKLINDFVNVYSAMYKSSKGNKAIGTFYRGTSKSNVPSRGTAIGQFLSTSTDKVMAQSFGNGEPALVHIVPDSDVPFLDAELYRDENRRDESEVIFAPFCKATNVEYQGKRDVYTYYKMRISKPELPEKTDEELSELRRFVLEEYLANIQDMKEYNKLNDLGEIWFSRAQRAENSEDKRFAFEKMHSANEKSRQYSERTSTYRNKLQDLLMGLCRQKELQIDEAYNMIQIENERKREETAAKNREEIRQNMYQELHEKLKESPEKGSFLSQTVSEQYQKMLDIERKYIDIANRLGILSTSSISHTDIGKKVEEIKSNLEIIKGELGKISISPVDSRESITQVSKDVMPTLNGVLYGIEISKDLPDVVKSFEKQTENELKKTLFFRVQKIIKDARVEKYLKDRDEIQREGIGFFGGINGRNDLQLEKLKNVSLKIQVAESNVPEEKEDYSVIDMLADMQACATSELGGKFTPEMSKLYQSIIQVFGIEKTKAVSEEIQKLAREKVLKVQTTLPAIQDSKSNRFLGRTKTQTELLKAENKALKEQVIQNKTKSTMPVFTPGKLSEQDALSMFELKLKAINASTRNSEFVRSQNPDRTFDLFG